MEKAINVKTKKVNLIFGFINDENYGVHYPTLTERFELTDLFPYINRGEIKLDTKKYRDCRIMWHLACACNKIGGSENVYKYDYYIQVDCMRYEPTLHVCFRIVEK